jgi:hypothetical protein
LRGSRQGLRKAPYYVAKIACNLYTSTLRKLHRYNERLRRAIVTVGLKLRDQVVKPYMCPICRKGAKGGKRPFKSRRGLFLHLTHKHYGDLIDMVVEAYNDIKGVDCRGRVAGEVERVLSLPGTTRSGSRVRLPRLQSSPRGSSTKGLSRSAVARTAW